MADHFRPKKFDQFREEVVGKLAKEFGDVSWRLAPVQPKPDAVDYLAAIEDPAGSAAELIKSYEGQQAKFIEDCNAISEIAVADTRHSFVIDLRDGGCVVSKIEKKDNDAR